MKSSAPALLLASLLLTGTALAQDAAPAADAAMAEQAEQAAPATDAAPAAEAAPAMEAAPAAAPAVASSLDPAIVAMVGTPPPGKGLVVFYRPSKFTGSAIGIFVRENGAELAKLKSGNWFAMPVAPGAHAFAADKHDKDITNIEVEAGETYFLSGNITMGMMKGHANLSPSDAAAFAAAMPKLKAAVK
jgi:hypothetical protein